MAISNFARASEQARSQHSLLFYIPLENFTDFCSALLGVTLLSTCVVDECNTEASFIPFCPLKVTVGIHALALVIATTQYDMKFTLPSRTLKNTRRMEWQKGPLLRTDVQAMVVTDGK